MLLPGIFGHTDERPDPMLSPFDPFADSPVRDEHDLVTDDGGVLVQSHRAVSKDLCCITIAEGQIVISTGLGAIVQAPPPLVIVVAVGRSPAALFSRVSDLLTRFLEMLLPRP